MAQIVAPEDIQLVRGKPAAMLASKHTLCPGCGESVAGRVIAEILDELGLREQTVLALGVGCSLQLSNLIDIDFQQALHGRAPAMATGIKRVLPNNLVLTIQGDGDLMSEGVSEVLLSASRAENFTVICFNNLVNGETGGHMTAASIVGQHTKTTLNGRTHDVQGGPLMLADLIATVDGTVFAARSAMHTPAEIQKAKRYIRRAFDLQMADKGFTYVELLTMCPTGWIMEPVEAIDYIEDTLSKIYELGIIKDTGD
jgi:2-oxoglutarate/2-oxoacid ferredoxin oxidoreductase subunit beta